MKRVHLLGILLLAVGLAGCQKENAASNGTSQSQGGGGGSVSAEATSQPTVKKGLFTGLSLNEAKAKAQAENKLVFIDFYADWCGPCKMLDEKVWPNDKVGDWLGKHAICLKVDVDSSEALARQFNISAMPTLVFLDSSGNEAKRLVGFRGPDDFMKEVAELAK